MGISRSDRFLRLVFMLHIVLRHLSGSRAPQLDVIPLGAHEELVLGRAPNAAVRFDARRDGVVGRLHARIARTAGQEEEFILVDLESRNGTFLNGERVEVARFLRSGDTFQLGLGGPVLEFGVQRGAAAGD